ncbi:hypothetical protein BG005_011296 [Podila minutissima]|nr:hypothetical protein BG005_011296 [Podila minutissima]
MNALTSASVRMLRAPVQGAVRQYSAAATNTTANATGTTAASHSTQRLVGASAVSFVVGVDITYAYFYFKNK